MNNLIYPCLWFDANAKQAADFYCSVFKNTTITDENPMVVTLSFSGQKLICLNGGPEFKPNPSLSFLVLYEHEHEVDHAWNMLLEGGSVLMPIDNYGWSKRYGWIQDKFGISWQLYTGKMEETSQYITPLFMFSGEQNGKAEEAMKYYTSLFEDSKISEILRYNPEDNEIESNIKHAQFHLGKQVFMAMDSSGPHQFSFNEAISLVVECHTQSEIDYYWYRLTEDGQESMCGWLKDKYGVSWQVVPAILDKLLSDPNKSQRVINAFMKMKKFQIDELVNA